MPPGCISQLHKVSKKYPKFLNFRIMTNAIYTFLNGQTSQFRLAFILPSPHFTDRIECSLITTSIDDAPPYEALSYCWGDPNDTEPIVLSKSQFSATKNLASALRHLRLPDKQRLVWIDSICINQADNKERNHQVRQMQQIYRDADQVVVWLGEGEKDSSSVMTSIRAMYKEDLHWNNLKALFNMILWLRRPWWKRVWTVQEVILARHLVFVCGEDQCSGKEVFFAAQSFFRHTRGCCFNYEDQLPHITVDEELYSLFSEIQAIGEFHDQFSVSPIPLEKLLARFRHRLASDPYDNIYGFLGLTTNMYGEVIKYNKSFIDVFKTTTTNIIWAVGALGVLSQRFIEDNRGDSSYSGVLDAPYQLPSWCPDWSIRFNPWDLRDLNRRLDEMVFYNTSAGKLAYVMIPMKDPTVGPRTDIAHETLILRGLRFDTICELGKSYLASSRYTPKIYHQWDAIMTASAKRTGTAYPTGQDRAEAFQSTLCAGIAGQGSTEGKRFVYPVEAIGKPIFDAWWGNRVLDHLRGVFRPPSPEMPHGKWILSISTQVGAATRNRRFFVTEKGYFGLAPAATQPGDLVCILLGGRVPYIVRKTVDTDAPKKIADMHCTTYKFVGDAYVQGIMNGEAVQDLESDDECLEMFFMK